MPTFLEDFEKPIEDRRPAFGKVWGGIGTLPDPSDEPFDEEVALEIPEEKPTKHRGRPKKAK